MDEAPRGGATGATHNQCSNQDVVTVGDLLATYVQQVEGITDWGRSKKADITRLRASGLASKDVRLLTTADIIEYAKGRRITDGTGPATVLNDIIWLRQAFLYGATLFDIKQLVVSVDSAKRELMRTKERMTHSLCTRR